MTYWKANVVLLIAVGFLATNATAQSPDLPPIPPVPGVRAGVVSMQVNNMDAEPVKGAPFCGTVVTEHTQQFADGNRIHTSDSSLLCRDSQGRVRREASLNLMGMAPQNPMPKMITIVDPVAGVHYMLDPQKKIAIKGPMDGPTVMSVKGGGPVSGDKGGQVMFYQKFGTAGPDVPGGDAVFVGKGRGGPAPKAENLGDQTIDGIDATGTRMTTTIPAGKMGNEQPIAVTSERWYSSQLKATVMSKHSDPWSGELKTTLSNVNTAEPDPSLFAVPEDYKVMDGKEGPIRIQLADPVQ